MTSILIDRRDGLSSATAIKGPCRVATVSGTSPFTTLSGLQTIDDVSLSAGDRVLVKDHSNSVLNGIYVVDTGDWSRAKDFSRNDDIVKGTRVPVVEGTINNSSTWQVNSSTINIGFSAVTFDFIDRVNPADIINMTAASTLSGTELVHVVQSSANRKSTVSDVGAYVESQIVGSSSTSSGVDTFIGIKNGAIVNLPVAGVEVYPTLAEGADYRSVITAAITQATALAAGNGGHFSLKLHPGTYPISWDGASGISVQGNTNLTNFNNRHIFHITNFEKVDLDLSGVKLIHLGENKDEWSTVFRFSDSKSVNINLDGAVFDHDNLPFFQGYITAKGSDYLDIALETGCPAPVFSTAAHIEPRTTARVPSDFGIKRAFNATQLTVTDQGSGVWRVGGFTGGETGGSVWSSFLTVNTLVIVRNATDGANWFHFRKCTDVNISKGSCYVSACGLMEFHLCKDVSIDGVKCIERPGTKLTGSTSRAAIKLFSVGGTARVHNCEARYTGDDGLAVGGGFIVNMSYVDTTHFTGFMHAHYFGATIDIGDNLIFRDKQGTVTARAHVTAIASSSNYDRAFTVVMDSGSLPNPMTNYAAEVLQYRPIMQLNGNNYSRLRGRGIYAGGSGHVRGNNIEDTTGPGILIDYQESSDNLFSELITGLSVTGNRVLRSCVRTFYTGAIVIHQMEQGSQSGTASSTSTGFPISGPIVIGNVIDDTPNQAIILAGVDRAFVTANTINNVGSVGKGLSWNNTLGVGAVFALVNCRHCLVTGNLLSLINSSVRYTDETENSGTNPYNTVDNNINLDVSPQTRHFFTDLGIGTETPSEKLHVYKSGAAANVMVEASSTNQASLKLKNASQEWRMFGSANGLFIVDTTASANRWQWDTTGSFTPGASNTYSIGQTTNLVNTVYSNRFATGAINALILAGSASPEGVQTAGVGSIYQRGGGGAGTSLYVKESGSGNTGWVALGMSNDVMIPAVLTVPNTGLHLLDTNASHDLIIKPGSDLSADRTLTITTGDADRTLTLANSGTAMTRENAETITAVKTYTLSDSTTLTDYMYWKPSDWGVGKPRLVIRKSSTATFWSILLDDGVDNTGTINFTSTALTWNANQIADLATAQTFSGAKVFSLPPRLPTYTVATVPSASTYSRGLIYVSDGTASKRLAISDGTNWRFPDGNIVS